MPNGTDADDENEPPQPQEKKQMSRRRLLAGLGGGAAAVAVGGGALGYAAFLAPSADPHRYSAYWVDDQRELLPGEIRVTFLGTATLLVDDGTTQILFDAFITDVPLTTALLGELQTDERQVDSVLASVGADHVSAVFVSHSHYDHSLDAAYLATSTGATLHGSSSTLNIGRGGDVPEAQLAEYVVGAPIAIGDFTVTVLESQHSPGTVGGDGTPISEPLRQPTGAFDYYEGGSFDFLLAHGDRSILIKASAGYRPGALDDVRADVMFCGTTGSFGKNPEFRDAFFDDTIAKVDPQLLVPLHWNSFFLPVSHDLTANMKAIDDVAAGFDYLINRLDQRHARFAILQGYSSIHLFRSAA